MKMCASDQVFGFSCGCAAPTVRPVALSEMDFGLETLHLRQTWPYGLWNHTYFGIRLLAWAPNRPKSRAKWLARDTLTGFVFYNIKDSLITFLF